MNLFLSNILYSFLIAFGIVIGASVFAGVGAIVNNHPPLRTMLNLAGSVKIWAVAAALGGTFSSFEIFEKSLFNGEIKSIIKQITYIFMALLGANLGYGFIRLIGWCGELWTK
jgi:hypothetical protein